MTIEEKNTIKIGDVVFYNLKDSPNKLELRFGDKCEIKRHYDNNGMYCIVRPDGREVYVHSTDMLDKFALSINEKDQQQIANSFVDFAVSKLSQFINDERFDNTDYTSKSKFGNGVFFNKELLLNDFKEFLINS